VLAVKIDNIAQSRSQTGLSKADIVCGLLLTQFGQPGFAYSGAKPKLLPVAAKARSSADSGTTFTTASGQPMTFAREPVWVVLAVR
jgi:hypothetical protein